MNLNFLCRCCKRRIVKDKRPIFIESAGLHEKAYQMEWMRIRAKAEDYPGFGDDWEYVNETPKVGEIYELYVEKPFDEEIGGTFTNLFEPREMAVNGWGYAEKPEDIYKAAAVLCRFVDVIQADEYSGYIHVEVLNVVPLSELYKVIPEQQSDIPVEVFDDIEDVWTEYEDEHWLCRDWNGQGDVGAGQWLYTDEKGISHEVMTNWWDFDDNTYTLSNIVSKSGAFPFGDRKRYIYYVSPQFRMGWGYMDSLRKNRKHFAFCGQPDGTLSVVLTGDAFRLSKDYPVGIPYTQEQAEEFREKYIDGKKPCVGEDAVIREFVVEYLAKIQV